MHSKDKGDVKRDGPGRCKCGGGESGAQLLTSSLNIQAQVIEIEIYGKNAANDANLYSHLHVYIAIYNVNLISIL